MKKLLLLLFLTFGTLYSQDEGVNNLDEIVLKGNFSPVVNSGYEVQLIADSILKESYETLGNLLQKQANFYFKQNGNGMVSSISLRGTSASQTGVYWNGISINSALNGQTDFNTLQGNSFDELEVRKGGASVLLGNGSVGGAINLKDKVSFEDGQGIRLLAGAGSYETYFSQLTAHWSNDQVYAKISGGIQSSVNDYDYLETLGLELVQGRSFDKNYSGDSQAVIINESMAKELGESDPLSASLPMGDSLRSPVIGVVKDYNFQDISKSIEPLTFFLDRESGLSYVFVKVAPVNMANSFDAVESAWKSIEPNAEFLGSFLDENIDNTFAREKKMATMITSGSIIAIALSCIGLFAMSLLIVAQRTKEIGVRKVLGASVSSITVLLTKEFLQLVLISFVISTPIAWWFLRKWLENYENKLELNIWFFAIAGLLAMSIAFLTVGSRTINAAMQNPVKSLRDE